MLSYVILSVCEGAAQPLHYVPMRRLASLRVTVL